jgi:hypothetical protein
MKTKILFIGLFTFLLFTTLPSQATSNDMIQGLCSIDCKSEFQFFKRYAKQGSSLADLSLAVMYFRGQGTEVNIPVGKRYLERAAKAGEPGAEYQLGYLLMHGIYMPQDIERSLNWFKRAVKYKVPGAKKKVATIERILSKDGLIKEKYQYKKQVIDRTPKTEKYNTQNIEVITVTFTASYKHILEAARAQTCNTNSPSCQAQWKSIIAPLIVLSKGAIDSKLM